MKREDWQNAFGQPDEDFRLHLRQTLDDLEEKNVKKRTKISTLLVAAALMIAVLAGAGIAASQLGVFDMLDTAEPIVPLPGAEELVGTNLGSSENEYAILTVEEAVFDGQGVLVQCRLSPKQEKHVLYDAFFAESPLVETKLVPARIADGSMEYGPWTVINGENDKRLMQNGAELAIPASLEEAQEKNLPVYVENGIMYDAMAMEVVPAELEEGWELIDYRIGMSVKDGLIFMDSANAEGHEDGSVTWWQSGMADEVLDVDEIEMTVSAYVQPGDERLELPEVTFALPKTEAERKYTFTPAGDAFGERFEILNCSMVCTKVRGYLKVDYRYQQAETGEEMGIDFNMYDAAGNPINVGGGSGSEENGVYTWNREMQSFEEIPETIFLEAKVIGEDKTLGRVECKLVEK